MRENREGYEQLAVQVAGLLTAVASVLQPQRKQDEALNRVLQANIKGLLRYVSSYMGVCVALSIKQLACSGRSRPPSQSGFLLTRNLRANEIAFSHRYARKQQM
jgi:hypothetical protein